MGNPILTEKRLMNIAELSGMLGVCVNTIYSWISQKKIPHVKLGHLVRFDREQIHHWLQSKRIEAPDRS